MYVSRGFHRGEEVDLLDEMKRFIRKGELPREEFQSGEDDMY